jgi:hypothetical protein
MYWSPAKGEKMKTTVNVPKAFSVRDEHEFLAFRHLMNRLNIDLQIEEVGQGLHVNGGSTVYWGVVFLKGNRPSKEEIVKVMEEAGFDNKHNGAIIQW